MTTHNFSATATDTMSAEGSAVGTINSISSATPRTIRRSFMEHRVCWGNANQLVSGSAPLGPTFTDDTPCGAIDGRLLPSAPGVGGDDTTVATIFQTLMTVRFVGLRVYKAPNHVASGGVPFRLWQSSTANVGFSSTGTTLDSVTSDPWVADDGGWRTIMFSGPTTLSPGHTYVLGMYAEEGIFSYSNNVWEAQDTCVWPLMNRALNIDGTGGYINGSVNSSWNLAPPDGGILFPRYTGSNGCNYYIDPIVEWEEELPGYAGGDDYHQQWMVDHTRHNFPVAVFFSDPEYVVDYYDMGVNTLMAGSATINNAADYREQMALTGTGYSMDWWPALDIESQTLTFNPAATLVQEMEDDPDLASQITGYLLWDEPDMAGTYRPLTTLRAWHTAIRKRDSTRPIYMNFGWWPVRNQGFAWAPSGSSAPHPQVVNELWREQQELTDIMCCDDYQWIADFSAGITGVGGVWCYAEQVHRMGEIDDGRKPKWMIVETTSQIGDAVPDPDDVDKAIWAGIIAGARGVVLFDHRFPNNVVTQDFAHMLHNPPMKEKLTDTFAMLQTLGLAIRGPELGLVTGYTTSNKTSGPMGGTYGVPIHYASRQHGSEVLIMAQAIRPGATTGTLTIPSLAGETLAVLGESRSVAVSGGGVLTDTFAADYSYHLYTT